MLKIGLTGGIGSGKTAVADLFSRQNIPVIDTDKIAHELLREDKRLIGQLAGLFGEGILDGNGQIDRKQLAGIVFSDQDQRHRLEKLMHPLIREQVQGRLQKLANSSPSPYVVIVVPLLLETGFDSLVDRILVIDCEPQTRLARVQARDQRSADEIRSIMDSQMPDQQRLAAADDVIDNSKDINHLQKQVDKLHRRYLMRSAALDQNDIT